MDDLNPLQQLQQAWSLAWPKALACWSRYIKLSAPRWCLTIEDEKRERLLGSFAMIRLQDQAVVISLRQVQDQKLERFATEILAHEIGHHVYCPATLLEKGRLLARMQAALPSVEVQAPLVANLYSDLLINDRLQRSAGLDMAGVFLSLPSESTELLWSVYLRIYEILWSLQRGSLVRGELKDAHEGDARLGARLLRSYSRDWMEGGGRFAALMLPYLLAAGNRTAGPGVFRRWLDTMGEQPMDIPAGLAQMEAAEQQGALHPALDPSIAGVVELAEEGEGTSSAQTNDQGQKKGSGSGGSQFREPFEYGSLLRSLGLRLDQHEIAVQYYRERALPHLVRYPQRLIPRAADPLPEGLIGWDLGQPLSEVDWLESVLKNPAVIPGVTTVQRSWGQTEGDLPERRPLDLDLYIDSSGSMPDPARNLSYLALAGTIVALSALRAGARVQATLWSGAGQFTCTPGFCRDERQILRILTGYLGGATAFPLSVLRQTYGGRGPLARPVHILVISDDGVTTMFQPDERRNSGWDLCQQALQKARGGGTLLLNVPLNWQRMWPDLVKAQTAGWQIHPVLNWEDLVAFAIAFSKLRYEEAA